jgi:hypothetical protein
MKRLLTAFLLSATGAATALGAGPSPILLVPTGSVDVRSGPTAPWRQVTAEEAVVAGDEVRTSRTSMAELRFVDGSRVQMNRGSLFSIDKTDSQETSFTLKAGKIRAAFAGLLSSRVSIRTPTAVCAVRGTVFDIGADDNGHTEVSMAEGVLEVKDNKGREAVITSEETMKIGEGGMERPQIVALNDDRALPAVRPYAVHQEMARDATRKMLEDVRNRELKANEAQLGKSVVDAFGRRVRLEEYLLRPAANSYEVLFLSRRENRFDWGHLIQTFNSTIPDDISLVPAIVRGTFLSETQPANWLKSTEFYATNTVDALKENITLGDPVQISFSGYGAGSLWYPSSVDFTQTLYGPGVPNGERVQFVQHQDYNQMTLGQFTWYQAVQPTAGLDNMSLMFLATLDPTNAADVTQGYTTASTDPTLYDNTNTFSSFPNGSGKADFLQTTVYPDASSVSVEKFLVSNDGKILDRSAVSSSDFARNGDYNIEINIKSSLFQNRDIDVLIAPEILRVKSAATSTGGNILAQ